MKLNQNKIETLNEKEGKFLLKQWEIPTVEEIEARSESEAVEAAAKIGYPVVVKVCSREILHKSDSGGVALNITNKTDLIKAVGKIELNFSKISHTLLIQKMVPGGIELILGAKRDAVFGPIVLIGIGGIFTEVLQDSVLELAPVDLETAFTMLSRLKGSALLQGFRGQPSADRQKIAEAIVALSEMMTRRDDIFEIDVNPLIVNSSSLVAVDALVRIVKDSFPKPHWTQYPKSIEYFFNPKSVALIGASRDHQKGGHIILRNIIAAGFKGNIYPVNPSGQKILGLKTYKTISEVPEPVDLAMIVTPKDSVPGAIERCAQNGVKNIILSTGGYSDIGESGREEQEILSARSRNLGMRLMGPNSIGTINPRAGLCTSIVTLEPIDPGGVAIFGQSGVFSSGWSRWIGDFKPYGVAKIACIGNKGDVNETDVLEFLADDPETTTIGMYIEGISDGTRFVEAARMAAAKKPVVILKAGRSEAGAQAIASHTGTLAATDNIFDAVCHRCGVIRVLDSEAFHDTLSAFEKLPLPRGNRMGVLSITGLGCVLTTDTAEDLGIQLPALQIETINKLRAVIPNWAPIRNPVDIWSAVEQNGSKKTMQHIAQCLFEQDDIDSLLIIFVLMPESIFNIEDAFSDLFQQYRDKPVFVSYFGGSENEIRHIHRGFSRLHVPCYPSPERALAAFRAMVDYARFRAKHLN
ncbi:MAG: acetate--CoA ligase family protein [Desulfobacterales bacterium]|nr:acetate--CoA ligase family protein [Desulfobacterales bacterium]